MNVITGMRNALARSSKRTSIGLTLFKKADENGNDIFCNLAVPLTAYQDTLQCLHTTIKHY
ncbi:MAG: hypothetical protein LBV64_07375 [Mediterranea sp.]|nr:hypothetical protein [Mediterranea sp.]